MTELPTDAASFATWRKSQTFATSDIERTAFLVERDMRNVENMGDGATPTIKRMADDYRANFGLSEFRG